VRILGFGTYDLAKHPRVGIILDGFRALGDDVVELNEPLGFTTAQRVAMLRKPWLAYRLVLRVLVRWAALVGGWWRTARHRKFDAVIVGYLGQFDVLLARLLYPRGFIVLDLMIFGADTARDRGVTTGPKHRILTAIDQLAVSAANVVVLDTPEHLDLLRPRDRAKAVVVEVGAPTSWLAVGAGTPRERRHDGGLRVIFFGLYTPLQGATVIGDALAQLADRPDITVTMVGKGQDYEATRERARHNPNVRWLDWVEAEELPKLAAEHDLCLGIFGTGPKAQRVVPNKVYQGAAAGCAILTSDTVSQRRTLGDAAVYVPAGDAEALAALVRKLADNPDEIADLQARAHAAATDRFTPSAIVVGLRDRLAR